MKPCCISVEARLYFLQVGSPFTLEISLGAISSIEKVGKSKKKEKKDALYGLELVCKVCCGHATWWIICGVPIIIVLSLQQNVTF